MKHFYRSMLAILMLFSFLGIKAQGWPADYDGVMLQGFYWDSYNDTKWKNLEKQAEELSSFFDLIWIPNSASSDNGMGYMPVYWFSNYNSAFGTEAELKSMIKTFKAKGTGFIADVVINHRNGNMSAWNFPSETYNGKTYKMADGSIVSNDNIWSTGQSEGWGKDCPSSYKGNADTGDRFDGCRDLDHTNATVQEHCKAYTEFLLKELEYVGFRYDMVKGYKGEYTKIYNEYSKPRFSVGEYWDSSYDNVANWINATGKTSAAFDFPCKYQINKAFPNNLSELVWKANGTNPQPAGMIHYGYPQYAVTFVDNHDTYRDGSKFTDDAHVLAANAFILCSPGTPCVFLRHYIDNKKAIQEMINARKSAGITNTSTVKVLKTDNSCYMAEVTGKRGTLVVKIGSAMISPDGYSDSDIMASGNDYCIWVKSDGSYVPTVPKDDTPENGITIYYNNSNTNFNPVYCYSFANDSDNEKPWPGYQMTAKGANLYSVIVPQGTNVVFNNGGNGLQTVDVLNVKDGYVYTGQASKDAKGNYNVDAGALFDGTMPAPTTDLYMNGNFDGSSEWDPKNPKTMDKEPGHYTLRNVQLKGSGESAYFSFADTKGDWDTVNAGTRYGADSENMSVTVIKDSSSTTPQYTMTAGNHAAWMVPNGNYDIIVEPGTWKLTVYVAGKAPSFTNDNKDDQNQGGDDQNQGGDDQNQGGDDQNQGGDDQNQGGDDQNQGGEDQNQGGDDQNQGGDDQNQGGDDQNQGGDDQNQGGDDQNQGGDDQNQGGDDQNQGGDDQNQGGDDQNQGGDDQNQGGDDNNEGDMPEEDDNNPGNQGGEIEDPDAGVNGIEADQVEAEFYTLQGFKVQNPTKGMYIKVTGNNREKVVIR